MSECEYKCNKVQVCSSDKKKIISSEARRFIPRPPLSPLFSLSSLFCHCFPFPFLSCHIVPPPSITFQKARCSLLLFYLSYLIALLYTWLSIIIRTLSVSLILLMLPPLPLRSTLILSIFLQPPAFHSASLIPRAHPLPRT